MKGCGWALLVLLGLLAGTGGAAWAYAHRGYPDTVFYRRLTLTVTPSGGPGMAVTAIAEQWYDPLRRAFREHETTSRHEAWWTYVQGSSSTEVSGEGTRSIRLSAAALADDARDWAGIRQDGAHAQGIVWLAAAREAVRRVSLLGRQALLLTIAARSSVAHAETIWLDAGTGLPLQSRVVADGDTSTFQYGRILTLAPGTLPPGFFDPPADADAPWTRALGWLAGGTGATGS